RAARVVRRITIGAGGRAQNTNRKELSRVSVIPADETVLGPETTPDWCQIPSGGFFRLSKDGGEHDCHYHDHNELYLVVRGKAKLLNAGREWYVQARDIVCIKAGDEHDILEVYGEEDCELFWLYEPRPE